MAQGGGEMSDFCRQHNDHYDFCWVCRHINFIDESRELIQAADALANAAAQNNHLYNEMGEDLPDCKLCEALAVYDKARGLK
jgi:hypothetical protein